MNEELKTRWLEALRSGDYQQGNTCLRNEATGAYCCLGVLCELDPTVEWKEDEQWYAFGDAAYEFSGSILTEGYLKRIDMTPDFSNTLMGLNDEGVSFSDIADYIEKNL